MAAAAISVEKTKILFALTNAALMVNIYIFFVHRWFFLQERKRIENFEK
jgi:hypothetical protein